MSEENKAIVDRFIDEVMNKRSFSIFNDLFSPDFANHSPRLGIVDREYTAQETQVNPSLRTQVNPSLIVGGSGHPRGRRVRRNQLELGNSKSRGFLCQ